MNWRLPFIAIITIVVLAPANAHGMVPYNQEPYTHPQRLVDVGNGRRMNIYCTGTGSPTVILDSGLGLKHTGTLPWGMVQSAVERFTRVCSYDRAGFGFSDPGPLPRTTGAIVSDLHALLQRAEINPPYVMVGHSLGGFDVRLFADRYSSEVSGMVLVDPAAEGEQQRFAAVLPKYLSADAPFYALALKCANEARRGLLQKRRASNRCIGPRGSDAIVVDDPSLNAQVNAAIDQKLEAPAPWAAFISEATNAGFISKANHADEAEVMEAQRSYETMPLIVLTGAETYSKSDEQTFGASDAQITAAENAWNEMHRKIAAYSKRGVNCVVPRVDHWIQIERPTAVVDAIRQVIELTDTTAQPSCRSL